MRRIFQGRFSGNNYWTDLIYRLDEVNTGALNAIVVPLLTGQPTDPQAITFDAEVGTTYWATWNFLNDVTSIYFCISGPGIGAQQTNDTSVFTMYSGSPQSLVALDRTGDNLFTGQASDGLFGNNDYWVYKIQDSTYPAGNYYISFTMPLTGSFGLNIVFD